MIDELKTKIDWSCKFNENKYKSYEGCLRIVEYSNLVNVKPHKIMDYIYYLMVKKYFHIRDLIVKYNIKFPEVKEKPKSKRRIYHRKYWIIKVKNRFHYFGYFEDGCATGTEIEYLK